MTRNRKSEQKVSGFGKVAVSGVFFALISQFIKVIAQLGALIVLSRLLSVRDFGITAMAAPISAFALLAQDFGVTQTIIRRPDLDRTELNSLFWFSVLISAFVSTAMFSSASLIGELYRQPEVGGLIRAFSIVTLLATCGGAGQAIINRDLRFGTLYSIDIAGAATGLLVSIVYALVWPTYWALFWGALSSTLVISTMSIILCRWAPGMPKLRSSEMHLYSSGGGIATFNLANFFARNADNVLIGGALGAVPLGFYDRAYKLLLGPIQLIVNPLSRIMIPILARSVDHPSRYASQFIPVLQMLCITTLPGIMVVIVFPRDVLFVALGHEWVTASLVLSALACAAIVQLPNGTLGWLLVSQGRIKEYSLVGIITSIVSVIAFSIGLKWGVHGVAFAYATSEVLKTPFIWKYVTRAGPVSSSSLKRPLLLLGLPSAAAFIVVLSLGLFEFVLALSSIERLLVGLVASYAVATMGMVSYKHNRNVLRQVGSIVFEAARRR